jgi:LPS O-antigen subunit length determinant protein (WzzB/FepE family)
MQVKRDTPVLTVIQPVTVPSKPSNSRAKTLIVWTFLGFVLGCGIVFVKGYWPKLKEQLAGDPETGN